MKRRMRALFAALGLTAVLLTGCGTADTASDGSVADKNGDGVVGNDGVYGSADDGIYDSGTITDDVGSAVEDVGRAAENGAEDLADAMTGNDKNDNNTVTNNGSTVTQNGTNVTTTPGGTTNNP